MYNDRAVLDRLKSYGRLGESFSDRDFLVEQLQSPNREVRYLAICNLAKLADISLFVTYKRMLCTEQTSKVRMEIASAIGRLRSRDAIPFLKEMLSDRDPNVVLQAIRGLLVFRRDKNIEDILKAMRTHKNEIVRKVIDVEFFDTASSDKSHAAAPEHLKNRMVNANVLDALREVDNESIHLTFTSPPYYNARDYSIYNSYETYLEFLTKVFAEVHRITKEGRFFVLNTSPIIIPRPGRKFSSTRYPIPYDIHGRLMEMGWEFIDDIIWEKPEPSAKNRVAGFDLHRKPLAYKPNCVTEQLMVYRKQTNKLIDWVYTQYPSDIIEKSKVADGYERSNIWKIDPSYSRSHSAIFPLELCDRVIRYYSFVGDLVFDPFAGSGSVGISAVRNDRYFFLTEIDKQYFEVMQANLKHDMFSEEYKIAS